MKIEFYCGPGEEEKYNLYAQLHRAIYFSRKDILIRKFEEGITGYLHGKQSDNQKYDISASKYSEIDSKVDIGRNVIL